MDKRPTRVEREVWWQVYDRDNRRCIAPQLDPELKSPCLDRWGNPVTIKASGTVPWDLTFAHIKEDQGGARRHDKEHGVIVCWNHHVYGNMWATSKRGLELIRAHLTKLYPEIWDD